MRHVMANVKRFAPNAQIKVDLFGPDHYDPTFIDAIYGDTNRASYAATEVQS